MLRLFNPILRAALALGFMSIAQVSFSFIEIVPGQRDIRDEKEAYEEYQKKLNDDAESVSQENNQRAQIASQNIYNQDKNRIIKDFTTYRTLNPINLIHECRKCVGIERKKNNKKRDDFERLIVDELDQKRASKKSAVNYVSFASGGLFQDLMIINRAYQQGIRDINLHLIDISYHAYITAMEHVHGKRVEAFCACPVVGQLRDSDDYVLKAYLEKYNDTASLALRHEMISQFSYWILQQYPQMRCRVFLYRNAQEYQQAMKQNPEITADIIAATDLGDQQSEIDAAMKHLRALVQTTSWYNPGVTTLFMTTQGVISRNPDWIANAVAQAAAFVSTKKGKAIACTAMIAAGYYIINKLRSLAV